MRLLPVRPNSISRRTAVFAIFFLAVACALLLFLSAQQRDRGLDPADFVGPVSSAFDPDAVTSYAVGDSTVAPYQGQPSVISLIDSNSQLFNVAVPGHTISQQTAEWEKLDVQPGKTDWAVIQVGLNDLNPSEAPEHAISRLQGLVDMVRADIGPTAKLLIGQMLPCRQRMIDLYGPEDGLIAQDKWTAINEAIAGGGAMPITGVDGRVISHVAALSDENGNLAAAYDTGDGIHENEAGRQIIAEAWAEEIAALTP